MLGEITVLITGVGAPGAPGIIKCLKKNGERNIRLIGVDMNEYANGRKLIDGFYTGYAAKDDRFLARILEICSREKVDVVMPLVTKELELFSENSDLFAEKGIRVAVAENDSLHIANNKGLLFNAMKKNGMSVPRFYLASDFPGVSTAIDELGYPDVPVVVKPVFGNGSRGTRILPAKESMWDEFFNNKPNPYYMSKGELISVLAEKPMIPEMMIMEYLPGTEYSVDILADHGKSKYLVCRKGLNVVSSIMVDSVIVEDTKIAETCRKVVELLGLDGNIGFDMKENSTGDAMVMEINPRLTAGVVACAAAGVNMPYLRIKQLLGENLPDCMPQLGFMMQRRYGEVFFDRDGNEIEW